MRFPIIFSCQLYLSNSASLPSLSQFVTGADGGEICRYCRKSEEAHTSGTIGQSIAYFRGENGKSTKHW